LAACSTKVLAKIKSKNVVKFQVQANWLKNKRIDDILP
jgi:hypothetical protein